MLVPMKEKEHSCLPHRVQDASKKMVLAHVQRAVKHHRVNTHYQVAW